MHRSGSRSSRDIRISRSRERELEKARLKWMKEQEEKKRHYELMQKKIQEYEENRARELAARRNSVRSRVDTDPNAKATSSGALVMSEKFDSPSSNTRLFKGSEGTKIDVSELKKYQVKIDRKIPSAEKTAQIERGIVDPEELTFRRRDGEGAKPIFEREELKKTKTTTSEVKESREVIAIKDTKSDERPGPSRKRSASPSSRQYNNHSSHRSSRYESSSAYHHENSSNHRSHNKSERKRSTGRSRDRSSHHRDLDHHANRTFRSPSRDRESRHRSSRRMDRDSYHSYRDESRDRRNVNERLREVQVPLTHPYLEPMPVPIYYGISPMMAMRGPMPMPRGRMPPMMGPARFPPFGPRYMPPEMFRPNIMPNTRFGRMY